MAFLDLFHLAYGDVFEPVFGILYAVLIFRIIRSKNPILRSHFYYFTIATGLFCTIDSGLSHLFTLSVTLGKILTVTTRFTAICLPDKEKRIWTPLITYALLIGIYIIPFLLFAFFPFQSPIFAPTADGYGRFLGIEGIGYKSISPGNRPIPKYERAVVIYAIILTATHTLKSILQYLIPDFLSFFAEPILLVITSSQVRMELFPCCSRRRVERIPSIAFKLRVLEWIDLLKHPKTKRVAVRCFLYFSEPLMNDSKLGSPPKIKFVTVNNRYQNSEEPAKHEKNTVRWETYKYTLSAPKVLNLEHSPPSLFHKNELPDYAELLAKAINALLKIPHETSLLDKLNAKQFECFVTNFFKPVNAYSEYKQFDISLEMEEKINAFDKFIGKRGEFSKEMAETVLCTIITIANDLHIYSASPIHLATRNKDLDALIMMLCNNVKVNTRNKEGLTPLQVAVKNDFLIIAKTLILFDADVKSEVGRHLKKADKTGGERTHLLSLDGGGIRGLVLTTILSEIEAVVGKNKFRDAFKFTAGSSTGAILAIALSQGKSVAECRNIYFRLKDTVFYRSSNAVPYSHEHLEEVLEKELNGLANMASLKKEKNKFVVVTSQDSSVKPMRTVLFKSYKLKSETSHVSYETEKVILQEDQCIESSSESANSDSEDSLYGSDIVNIPERKKRMAVPIEPEKCQSCDRFLTKHIKRTPSISTAASIPDQKLTEEEIIEKKRQEIFGNSFTKSEACPFTTTIKFAARCSSAAPTFFESPDRKHIDGGVITNNPTEILLTEFHKVNNDYENKGTDKMNLGVVLSIGTGHVKDEEASHCEASCGFECVPKIIRFMQQFSGQIGRSDGTQVQQAEAHTQSMNGFFYRFTPVFDSDIGLDETNNEVLINMMWKTKVYMRKERAEGVLHIIDTILKQ
ncbi:hypothetical protein PRIPAC_95153 [Pristionchus pacificus]|uniref:phospholipase A2 n=1 Tax=Pristionchus pacificus TaxID=54126 RepID=A0A2A6CUX7_PRIPA|nr:hypothetical protein PRIPAC_95153 [Pristionchus pacificus]|eukprot:PDM81847.1 Ankyrin repeat-containing protein [Pristionchus pacificus]